MRIVCRSGILIFFLVIALGKETEGQECQDTKKWCKEYTRYCKLDMVRSACPKSCNLCLPQECQECEHNCTVPDGGSFECTCFSGYRLQSDGFTCEDIDECAEDPASCKPGKECVNVKGSYSCLDDKCIPFRNQHYQLSESYGDRCCKRTNGRCGQNIMNSNGTRIINGTTAKEGMWPWQVYVQIKDQTCGGTLLNDQWIVSAAHCFENVVQSDIDSRQLTAWVGVVDRTKLFTPAHESRKIVEIIRHEEYNYLSPKHDIALVKMDSPVLENDFIHPVCLPNGEVPPDGTLCVTTGYGVTEEFSNTPADSLKQVRVPLVNIEECRKSYEDSLYQVDTQRMVCAGYKEGGKDACRGDSGGPLVCQRCNTCDWFLAGITSFGDGCARPYLYGVYTNVEFYENWIESHIAGVTINKEICRPADWTEWSGWSTCSHDCGGGTRTRMRACLGGDLCPGEGVQTKSCNKHGCSVTPQPPKNR